jgi:hypothetical protein
MLRSFPHTFAKGGGAFPFSPGALRRPCWRPLATLSNHIFAASARGRRETRQPPKERQSSAEERQSEKIQCSAPFRRRSQKAAEHSLLPWRSSASLLASLGDAFKPAADETTAKRTPVERRRTPSEKNPCSAPFRTRSQKAAEHSLLPWRSSAFLLASLGDAFKSHLRCQRARSAGARDAPRR